MAPANNGPWLVNGHTRFAGLLSSMQCNLSPSIECGTVAGYDRRPCRFLLSFVLKRLDNLIQFGYCLGVEITHSF